MLKIISIFFLLFSFSFAETGTPNHDLDNAEMLVIGERLYQKTCISCHGQNGETDPNMKLIVKPRKLQKTILTQEQSYQIIKHGAHHFGAHADIMPAFKYVYNDEQMYSLAYFISVSFNPKRDEKIKKLLKKSTKLTKKESLDSLERGKKIFLNKCALCHGETGDGKGLYVEQSKINKKFIYPYNLTRTLLNTEQIFLYAKFGGHYWGTDKDDMPTWKKKLNDTKLQSVANYIVKAIKTDTNLK